jgi:hypothetical protein
MTEKIPVFLGEGDDRIQIGVAEVGPWKTCPDFTCMVIDIDAFPGERATLSRVAKWDEIVEYSKHHYGQEQK